MLSALVAVCASAGETLDIGHQTAITEVGSQLWTFLSVKQVRKANVDFPEEQIKNDEKILKFPCREKI